MLSGVATLVHHDDGKEKWESHEVYLRYPLSYEGIKYEGVGYGATFEEALSELRSKFSKDLAELETLGKMLLDTDALLPAIPVDCMGKEITKR